MSHLLACADERVAAGSRDACLEMATAIVTALARLEPPARDAGADWWRAQQATPADSTMVADLLASLGALRAVPAEAWPGLRSVVVPALAVLPAAEIVASGLLAPSARADQPPAIAAGRRARAPTRRARAAGTSPRTGMPVRLQ